MNKNRILLTLAIVFGVLPWVLAATGGVQSIPSYFGWISLTEYASVPTPPSGTGAVWVKNDGTPHFTNDAGTDYALLSSSTGAPIDAHYVTDRAESGLSNEVSLGALTTGLLYGTVSGGTSTISSKAIGTDVQAYDATTQAFAGLVTASDLLPYFTGTDTMATANFTSTARSLVDDSSTAAMLATLGAAPAPAAFQTFLPKNGSTNTALASGTSVCSYLGKAPVTASSWKVLFYQGTAGAAPTSWAEAALCSGGAPVSATNQSLTTAGYVDISSWIGGATGPQLLTISASFTAGDHMWLVIGENTTTRANVRSTVADEMDAGMTGSAAARPSTMGAGTAFTKSTTLAGPYAVVYPN